MMKVDLSLYSFEIRQSNLLSVDDCPTSSPNLVQFGLSNFEKVLGCGNLKNVTIQNNISLDDSL